jgi:hypothetical protein
MAARLAERAPAREDVADPERPSDEPVQRHSARGHVPASLARHELELVDDLGLDEGEIAADAVVAPEADAARIPIAADTDTGDEVDQRPRFHLRAGSACDVQVLDATHVSTIDDGAEVAFGGAAVARQMALGSGSTPAARPEVGGPAGEGGGGTQEVLAPAPRIEHVLAELASESVICSASASSSMRITRS